MGWRIGNGISVGSRLLVEDLNDPSLCFEGRLEQFENTPEEAQMVVLLRRD